MEKAGFLFKRDSKVERCTFSAKCFSAFNTPEESIDGNNCQEGMYIEGDYASQEDIANYGWSQYPLQEAI